MLLIVSVAAVMRVTPIEIRRVGRMLADLGFEALDAGDITRARLLEPLGMVWINQAILRGKGRAWAFAAVSA